MKKIRHLIKNNPANGLEFDYRYYKDDNHGAVPLIAEYDALHYLFNFYALPTDVQNKILDVTYNIDAADVLTMHYNEISRQMGYQLFPPEATVNSFGYFYMGNGRLDKAYKMFALNIKNYPESFNVYDGMGDYYSSKKDKPKAIEYFGKALKIKEYKETRDKLNKLLAEK